MATKKTTTKPKPKPKSKSTPKVGENEAAAGKVFDNLPSNEISQEEVQKLADEQNAKAIEAGKKLAADLYDPNAFGLIKEEKSQDELDALAMLKKEYELTQGRSADATLALEKLKAGMEGLNSQEGMALREQARRELDSQFRNQMAQAKANAARSMTRGAAANAQSMLLQRERAKAQGNLEQDLTVQNYGLKQQGVQNFANYINALERDEFNRRLTASGNLGNLQQAQSDAMLKRQQSNIDQNTAKAISNQQMVLGGAAIQSGLAANNYAQMMGKQNQDIQTALAKEQLKQSGRALDIYGRSSANVYGR